MVFALDRTPGRATRILDTALDRCASRPHLVQPTAGCIVVANQADDERGTTSLPAPGPPSSKASIQAKISVYTTYCICYAIVIVVGGRVGWLPAGPRISDMLRNNAICVLFFFLNGFRAYFIHVSSIVVHHNKLKNNVIMHGSLCRYDYSVLISVTKSPTRPQGYNSWPTVLAANRRTFANTPVEM